MNIVLAPHDVLAEKAKPVEKIDGRITHLLQEMEHALLDAKDPEGVGLAAPQVGKSLQIFMIKETPTAPLKIYINPVLKIPEGSSIVIDKTTGKKVKKGTKLEGCLSLKDIWGVVDRYPTVHLSYMDEAGKQHERTFTGFMSTIVQHEYDHLQGILFPKHVLEQGHQLYKSVLDEKGETVFEEINI